jgi:hypothetical protein
MQLQALRRGDPPIKEFYLMFANNTPQPRKLETLGHIGL